LEVVTLKKFILFQDLFTEQKNRYQQYLNRLFKYDVTLKVFFTETDVAVVHHRQQPSIETSVESQIAHQEQLSTSAIGSMSRKVTSSLYAVSTKVAFAKNEKSIDISDTIKWKITHELLRHMGGTVREIIKESNELNA
jgi:hypothetical protein